MKPHASSRGRGIFVLKDVSELPLNEVSVVSQYVADPLLTLKPRVGGDHVGAGTIGVLSAALGGSFGKCWKWKPCAHFVYIHVYTVFLLRNNTVFESMLNSHVCGKALTSIQNEISEDTLPNVLLGHPDRIQMFTSPLCWFCVLLS